MGRTMPQLNKKTEKKAKTRGPFTTNWYLYKTYLHPLSKESQTQKAETTTQNYTSTEKRELNSNQETENKTKFEETLLEAIDEGLSSLGESPKQALYSHLKETLNMNRKDIPHRIDEFTDAIEKIFGAGAKILEIQIMKCLFKKIDYNFKHYPKQKSLTFTEYITAVKQEKENINKIVEQELNLNHKQNGKPIIHLQVS